MKRKVSVKQGIWVNSAYAVCVTFIELGVLWKSCCSKPITSLLSLNLCKKINKIKQKRNDEYTHQLNFWRLWFYPVIQKQVRVTETGLKWDLIFHILC